MRMERPDRDKHSSLIQTFVNYIRNFFTLLGPDVNFINPYFFNIEIPDKKAIVFVIADSLQPSLTFVDNVRSLSTTEWST